MSVIFFIFFSQPNSWATSKWLANISEAIESQDYVAARILIKQAGKNPISPEEYREVHKLFYSEPRLGSDLLEKWDGLGQSRLKLIHDEFDKKFEAADGLLLANAADKAYEIYRKLLNNIDWKSDRQLGYQLLHRIGQALYAQKKFNQSYFIYDRISRSYINFTQVLFEKVWAAFRANRLNNALGGIASLSSSYLSSFLEPELYLVQFYIYKKLCRTDDIAKVEQSVQRFIHRIQTRQFKMADWAKMDYASYGLYRNLKPASRPSRHVTVVSRKKEMSIIRAQLKKNYAADVKRLQAQLDKVSAYIKLTVKSKLDEIPKVLKLPKSIDMLKVGAEPWENSDAEDWIDEIGLHVFDGGSQCKN